MVRLRLCAHHVLAVPQRSHRTRLGCYNVRDPLDSPLIAAATAGACIASCGGTPPRRRSSWATPDRSRSAASSPARPSPVAPRCWPWCWARCSSREVTSVGDPDHRVPPTGRRVFRMAPFHHHFELVGWAETTVIIRFWLLTAIACGSRGVAVLQRVAARHRGLAVPDYTSPPSGVGPCRYSPRAPDRPGCRRPRHRTGHRCGPGRLGCRGLGVRRRSPRPSRSQTPGAEPDRRDRPRRRPTW